MIKPSAFFLTSICRIGRTLAFVLAFAASLFTFPAGIVVMTACWLIAYSTAVVRQKRATIFLIAVVVVVLVKRVDWPLGLWLFMTVAVAAIVTLALGRIGHRRGRYLLLTLVWLAWVGQPGVDEA